MNKLFLSISFLIFGLSIKASENKVSLYDFKMKSDSLLKSHMAQEKGPGMIDIEIDVYKVIKKAIKVQSAFLLKKCIASIVQDEVALLDFMISPSSGDKFID